MTYNPLIPTDAVMRRAGDQTLVVLDCRFDMMRPTWGEQEYRIAHIPGARYAHLERDLSGPITRKSGRHPLPDKEVWLARVRAWGIASDSTVVVYDDNKCNFAARAWWMLRWIGHENVRVLDGGWAAWGYGRGPVTIHVPKPTPTDLKANPPLVGLVTVDQVAEKMEQGYMLLDARSPERFSGLVETFDTVAGHVPGARNFPFGGNMAQDGRLRAPQDLHQRYSEMLEETPPDQVMHMCGSGVTACVNLLAMEVAGLTGSSLYAGSWSEWIRDPERPVETGQ